MNSLFPGTRVMDGWTEGPEDASTPPLYVSVTMLDATLVLVFVTVLLWSMRVVK